MADEIFIIEITKTSKKNNSLPGQWFGRSSRNCFMVLNNETNDSQFIPVGP